MSSIQKLLDLMVKLRNPHHGCSWDRVQNFASVAPYTIEEAYEVADAIHRDDLPGLRDELGDLLFQVVFHARMAEEQDEFDFDDVARGICEKLERRHPHLFGSDLEREAGQQDGSWERIKAAERAENADESAQQSALDGIALALPALNRAAKLGKRASLAGFDWPDSTGVHEKISEELDELAEARSLGAPAAIEEELGDLLFSVVNLARHLGVDPEQALSSANRKFEARFRLMEESLRATGGKLETLSLEALEAAWQAAKRKLL